MPRKPRALPRQPIQIRRFRQRVPIAPHRVPRMVVRQQEYEIRTPNALSAQSGRTGYRSYKLSTIHACIV